MVLERTVAAGDAGMVLRDFIRREFDISSRLLKRLKGNYLITVNGEITYTNAVLSDGDVLRIDLDKLSGSETIVPEDIPLDILFEDEYLIVINKQPGLIIHPSTQEGTGTICNGLARHFEKTGCSSRIHPISRLDRGTSGVILFAKDSYSANILAETLRGGGFQKEYLGVVYGVPEPQVGFIDVPLGRVNGFIMLRDARCNGKRALTHYETLCTAQGLSLLLMRPVTGRTHQLRAHMYAIGHPIYADGLYGVDGISGKSASRQMLHSWRLTFPHPYSGERLVVTGKPPDDFQELLGHMGCLFRGYPES